jgi:hypothetical protein
MVSEHLPRGKILLQFDVVCELFFHRRISTESTMQHSGLREAAMGHDAAIFTASMYRLDVNTYISTVSGPHDFSSDVVAKFFLQSTTPATPLGDACVFAESYEFLCCQDTDVGHTTTG